MKISFLSYTENLEGSQSSQPFFFMYILKWLQRRQRCPADGEKYIIFVGGTDGIRECGLQLQLRRLSSTESWNWPDLSSPMRLGSACFLASRLIKHVQYLCITPLWQRLQIVNSILYPLLQVFPFTIYQSRVALQNRDCVSMPPFRYTVTLLQRTTARTALCFENKGKGGLSFCPHFLPPFEDMKWNS